MCLKWLPLMCCVLLSATRLTQCTQASGTTQYQMVSNKSCDNLSTAPASDCLERDKTTPALAIGRAETTKHIMSEEQTANTTHKSESITSTQRERQYDNTIFLQEKDLVEVTNNSEGTQNYPVEKLCNGSTDEVSELPDALDGQRMLLVPLDSNITTCYFPNAANKSVPRIEEGQIVSLATVSSVQFVTQQVLVPVVAFPGCVFNIISIYVLVKQGTESSSTRYLIALGVADLSYLCTSTLNWVVVLLNRYQYPSYVSLRLALRYSWLMSYFILLTGRYSNALVLLFSLDRFIAVKSPLKAKSSPLSRHSAKLCVALFVFLALLLMPNLFRREFVEQAVPNNLSILVFRWTPFANSNPNFYAVYTYIILVTLRLVPIVFTFILNVAIVVVVKLSTTSRVTKHVADEKRQQRELKITRVLVTVSLIFLVCVTPGFLHSMINNFYPAYGPFGTNRNMYLLFLYIVPVLDTINSTVNFFVYVLLSDRFRVVFLETFCNHSGIKSEIETAEEQMSN